jgi:hypothetical protein
MIQLKTIKCMIFLSIIFLFISCSRLPTPVCTNKTIYLDNIIYKENPANCTQLEPLIEYKNVTVIDSACKERESEIIKNYAACLRNLSKLDYIEGGHCYNDLNSCNDTLIDYKNRLNNISYYADKNR